MSPAPWQYDINKDRSRALIVDAEGFTVAEIAGYTDMTETVELMTAHTHTGEPYYTVKLSAKPAERRERVKA